MRHLQTLSVLLIELPKFQKKYRRTLPFYTFDGTNILKLFKFESHKNNKGVKTLRTFFLLVNSKKLKRHCVVQFSPFYSENLSSNFTK